MKAGYIQIYTGNGKGKTTASLGLAFRASGHGMKTFIGQFMKGQDYGEIHAVAKNDCITLEQFGDAAFIFRKEDVTDEHRQAASAGLARLRDAMLSGDYDIVIFEEVNVALWFGLLDETQVLAVLDEKPATVEVILTGRYAPEALIERADLVTEMREIKHYYTQNVPARKGIEK